MRLRGVAVVTLCLAASIFGAVALSASDPCDPTHPPGPHDFPNPNEGLSEEHGAPGCPDGMALVDDFCVDRFEAALSYVGHNGRAAPWSPFHNPARVVVRALSIRGAVPQGYISGEQAQAACQNSGKRLCTDREWQRACEGPRGWSYPYAEQTRYPTGSSKTDPPCNESRATHPAVDLFPKAKNPFSHIKNACISQLPRTVARSGSFEKCVTSEGIHDIMGNLHEWTADPAGTFRGGYFMDTKTNGSGCRYVTKAHQFAYWDYSTGFRCCADRR